MPNHHEFVKQLRVEWKRLWRERLDDKVRAEGIAINDYASLFIDKGTIIHATRDFKALNFKDILDQHGVSNAQRYISPNPQVGGWAKFTKDNITNQLPARKRFVESYCKEKKKKKHLKQSGRGWLHI
ncbi:MAG: hypothetical protein NWE98_10370 [Candidatus Bathyarchaeota archaeon]|nr:hypothetical protein [Candidatus Bathyarchaeota archaeon]